MIKRESINNSTDKYTILECNQCERSLVLEDRATNELIESKGWYVERKKCLSLCPDHHKIDSKKQDR